MEIVEIWQNLEKQRNTDHDFPPLLYVGEYKRIEYKTLFIPKALH